MKFCRLLLPKVLKQNPKYLEILSLMMAKLAEFQLTVQSAKLLRKLMKMAPDLQDL